MKTLFAFTLGAVAGGYVVHKVERATRAAHPVALADRAGRAAGGLQARIAAAAQAGRVAAADRETQLRRDYDAPPLGELPLGELQATSTSR